jgi:hypothetical protein
MASEIPSNITWTRRLEQYFSATGERAHCLSWAHQRAENMYAIRRTFIDLPVIAVSSVIGFLSVGQNTIWSNEQNVSNIFLGVLSLSVSVLNTVGAYFGWAKKTEAHRIAALHYAKLYRFISVEMALPREERTPVPEFLKYCKEQYDRLAETSPILPDPIIKEFRAKFSDEALKQISVPEQMNGLEAVHIYSEDDLKQDLHLELTKKRIENEYAKAFGSDALSEVSGIEKSTSTSNLENV